MSMSVCTDAQAANFYDNRTIRMPPFSGVDQLNSQSSFYAEGTHSIMGLAERTLQADWVSDAEEPLQICGDNDQNNQ